MINSAGGKYVGGVHSRWLFHGTGSASALDNIVKSPMNGFAPQVGTRAIWGYGSYFARDAAYPVNGGFCNECLDAQHNNMIMLCLVECGVPCVGEEHIKNWPRVREEFPLNYSSFVDSASSPEIYVVPGAQAFPAYIIHFQRLTGK